MTAAALPRGRHAGRYRGFRDVALALAAPSPGRHSPRECTFDELLRDVVDEQLREARR